MFNISHIKYINVPVNYVSVGKCGKNGYSFINCSEKIFDLYKAFFIRIKKNEISDKDYEKCKSIINNLSDEDICFVFYKMVSFGLYYKEPDKTEE